MSIPAAVVSKKMQGRGRKAVSAGGSYERKSIGKCYSCCLQQGKICKILSGQCDQSDVFQFTDHCRG